MTVDAIVFGVAYGEVSRLYLGRLGGSVVRGKGMTREVGVTVGRWSARRIAEVLWGVVEDSVRIRKARTFRRRAVRFLVSFDPSWIASLYVRGALVDGEITPVVLDVEHGFTGAPKPSVEKLAGAIRWIAEEYWPTIEGKKPSYVAEIDRRSILGSMGYRPDKEVPLFPRKPYREKLLLYRVDVLPRIRVLYKPILSGGEG